MSEQLQTTTKRQNFLESIRSQGLKTLNQKQQNQHKAYRETEKSSIAWKGVNTEEIKDCLELSKNGYTTFSDIHDMMQMVFRDKFTALSIFIKNWSNLRLVIELHTWKI